MNTIIYIFSLFFIICFHANGQVVYPIMSPSSESKDGQVYGLAKSTRELVNGSCNPIIILPKSDTLQVSVNVSSGYVKPRSITNYSLKMTSGQKRDFKYTDSSYCWYVCSMNPFFEELYLEYFYKGVSIETDTFVFVVNQPVTLLHMYVVPVYKDINPQLREAIISQADMEELKLTNEFNFPAVQNSVSSFTIEISRKGKLKEKLINYGAVFSEVNKRIIKRYQGKQIRFIKIVAMDLCGNKQLNVLDSDIFTIGK